MSGLVLEQELAVSHLMKQSVQVVMYVADYSFIFYLGAVVLFCLPLSVAIVCAYISVYSFLFFFSSYF